MAAYFLDTSATVKRYVIERGHVWVASLIGSVDQHTVLIDQITTVESVAALCQKARSLNAIQKFTVADRDRAIELFHRDVQDRYDVIPVTTAIFSRAGNLCRFHALRAYDAVQLACALAARDSLAQLHLAPIFVSADRQLLAVATREGFATEDPNAYP